MIPDRYSISNFKSICSEQSVDLSPVTLLFGKNSSGKSSIIQSLLLCRHALINGDFNFRKIRRWGQEIDLGGFHNYVHRHEAERDLSFSFSFKRTSNEKTSTGTDSYVDRKSGISGDRAFPDWSFHFYNFIDAITIKFEVGIPEKITSENNNNEASTQKIIISVNNSPLITLGYDTTRGNYIPIVFHTLSPEMTAAIAVAGAEYHFYSNRWNRENAEELITEFNNENEAALQSESILNEKLVAEATEILRKYLNHLKDTESKSDQIDAIKSALNIIGTDHFDSFAIHIYQMLTQCIQNPSSYARTQLKGKGLKYEIDESRSPFSSSAIADDEEVATNPIVYCSAIMNQFINGEDFDEDSFPLETIPLALRFDIEQIIESAISTTEALLADINYIGPFREIPSRFHDFSGKDESSQNDEGHAVITRIATNERLTTEISKILQEVLDSPYRLETRKLAPSMDYTMLKDELVRQLEVNRERVNSESIEKMITGMSQGKTAIDLKLVDIRTNTDVDFCDVGFGIVQVLPLIAEITDENHAMMCVEQPEIHLHPKMQGDLGEVIANQVRECRKTGKVFLMETHSEDMIIRLLRLLRESYEKIAEGEDPKIHLLKEDLSVNWVSIREKETEVKKLKVNEEGDFDESWPEGFFDDRLDDLI